MASPAELHTQLVALLPRLRRFARTLTRNVHDADDLVQLALERALTRAAQLHADAPLAGWVYGIVRHAWIDEIRARERHTRLLTPEAGDGLVGRVPGTADAEQLAVQEALASLPEEQRSAVALVLIEGLSYKEAAYALGVPVGTLTSRLARGRGALQRVLGDSEPQA
ncbi:MAG TPA: sigma-70 family RNA polymerase sigma factor [Steroidobacteraceae bacterium]|nr:sigma-70 family RNA polymerase sigma factor [Steroidobacteraceae bacterium]